MLASVKDKRACFPIYEATMATIYAEYFYLLLLQHSATDLDDRVPRGDKIQTQGVWSALSQQTVCRKARYSEPIHLSGSLIIKSPLL